MTMNFLIEEFESEHILKIKDDDNKFKIKLDWVSHGNFAIYTEHDYIELEKHHFREILDAYENAVKPSGRKPFWTGTVPPRGWSFGENLIEAYAYKEKYIKLIKSSCTSFGGDVPHYFSHLIVEIETLKKISDAVDRSCKEQFAVPHYG